MKYVIRITSKYNKICFKNNLMQKSHAESGFWQFHFFLIANKVRLNKIWLMVLLYIM